MAISLLAAVLGIPMAAAAPWAAPAAAQVQEVAAATQARTITPRDVARIQTVGGVAIRPDGSSIAYTVSVPRELGKDENGSAWTHLRMVSFDGSDDRPFVTGEVSVSQLSWSPDGNYLSYVARREGDDHRSIYVIPAEAGESVRLFQHETDIEAYDWRPDGSAIAFIAREEIPADLAESREQGFNQEVYEEDWQPRRLYILELPAGPEGQAGDVRTIDLPGQPWHVVWSPSGDRLLTDLSPTPLTDDRYMFRRLSVVDASSGSVKARIENPGKLGVFRWSPDGKTIVIVSGADINDPLEGRLMAMRAEGGELRDIIPELEGHVADFRFLPNGRIVYLANVGVGTVLARVRADGRSNEVLFEGTDPVFGALSLDARGRRVAVVAESAAMPGEVFALSLERRGDPTRLTDVNPWLADIELAEQEIVRWTAPDGLAIEGLLIHPVARVEGARVPTVVVAHGGPESHYKNGWLTRYNVLGQMAAARGYAVFYPNYRGSTGRGVAFAKADQGDGMGAEFDDVLAGIDALVERGLADPDRVAMTGGSYGGYFTAWAATRHSERFAAGVMLYGVANQLSKTGTSDITNELELVHWLTNPYKDLELFMERSPVLYVENAQTPLLILHGSEDARVYPGQTLEMYRALKVKGDVPVRAVFYPGEGHGFRKAAARYDCSLRMLRWLDHFLKEGRSDLPPWRLEYGLAPEVM
jgi:dipeptidyl aminopeptidase/acylaminoacyl peptidase